MIDDFQAWFWALDPTLQVYWGVAIITSSLFIIQTLLTFLGLGHGDVAADVAFDTTPDGGLDGIDGALQIFTVRNLVNFLLGLSWGGICMWSTISNKFVLAVTALLIGVAFVVAFLAVYRLMMRLQGNGNIRMESAIGKTCQVYLRIPAERSGAGKVQVSFSGSVQEIDAVTDGDTLPSGTRVRIVEVVDSHTFLVTP